MTATDTVESTDIEVNGLRMHVRIAGRGNPGLPVLLVHGFPDTHAVWRKTIPALVEAGHYVIAPDLRGCGDTDMPVDVAAYRRDVLVADLRSLLDAMGIEKVKLVGHDWGAILCWLFAIAHPQRVERMAVLSVGHPDAYARAGWRQKLKAWYTVMFLLRGVAEWIITARNWAVFRKLTGYAEENAGWISEKSRPGRLRAGLNYYRANMDMILPRNLPKTRVPVCAVFSTGDRFLDEGQMLDSRNYVDAAFTYHRVEGANHWLQLDAPDRVNPLLVSFLR